jgi:hypothetical protein
LTVTRIRRADELPHHPVGHGPRNR